jgi:serine/threonine-protein phosphatase PP1 catalytic subunit
MDVVEKFLSENNLDMICRAHQLVQNGYDFPFHDHSLVTVFSAPNYCDEAGNRGAVLNVAEDLGCRFEFLEPVRSPSRLKWILNGNL